MKFEKHNYHLVDPSPWPALGSLGVIILAFGAISYFGDGLAFGAEETTRGSMLPMLIGLGVVLFTMAVWWIDVVKESHSGFHNKIVQIGLKYGMVLFIASEVCFFVAFFWAFFDPSLYPGSREAIGGVWPPEGVETMHAMGIPVSYTHLTLPTKA